MNPMTSEVCMMIEGFVFVRGEGEGEGERKGG